MIVRRKKYIYLGGIFLLVLKVPSLPLFLSDKVHLRKGKALGSEKLRFRMWSLMWVEQRIWIWVLLPMIRSRSKVEVALRLTVSQSVCLGIEHLCGSCDQILLPVGMLVSEICGLVSIGCPLWREDRFVICSVITQWSNTDTVSTSQVTHYVSATETNQLMLFSETVAVYWENHTEQITKIRL
jgi:hypothetical protein